MSEKIGSSQFGSSQGGNVFLGRDFNTDQNYSDHIAYEIDQEIQKIVNKQYERAKQILTEKRDLLDKIAQALIETRNIECGTNRIFERSWALCQRNPMRKKTIKITTVEPKKEE